jgi:hypothetical protein
MTVQFAGTTGEKSTFKLEPPTCLRLKLMLNGEPLKNEPCEISFDGTAPVSKSADGNGILMVPVPRGARRARVVCLQHRPVEHTLRLGLLPSVDTVSGQKLRLRQMGYYSGKLGELGTADADLRNALINFQKKHNLTASGTLDAATKAALKSTYGC